MIFKRFKIKRQCEMAGEAGEAHGIDSLTDFDALSMKNLI